MKRTYQGILDFIKSRNNIIIEAKINETISATLILKMGKEVIDLTGKKVNIYVVSKKDNNEFLYSNSKIKIINPKKGLVNFELPGFTFRPEEYEAEIEIIDVENNNYLSCRGINFKVENTLNNQEIKYFISQREIDTLMELDAYVSAALQRLAKYEKKMEEIDNVK